MRVINVPQNLEGQDYEKQSVRDRALVVAVNNARPGDIIEVSAGRYTAPIRLNQGGKPGNPIVIRGEEGNKTLFDAERAPDDEPRGYASKSGRHSFISIIGVDHVRIENIAFDNCWSFAILLEGARHIGISNCAFVGGMCAIMAKGDPGKIHTSDIHVERCKWIQDPNHDMWHGRITWPDIKRPHIAQINSEVFNGAFFLGFMIEGNVTIDHCDISHCFNGIIFWGAETEPHGSKNIKITNCRFSYIRDNAVEPENYVENLWVSNNTFYNIHGTFSLMGLGGKNWYFFGNNVLNLRRPGRSNQGYRGGKVLKFHTDEPMPTGNFVFAFNSVLTRTSYFKSGTTRHWSHFNNAISICRFGPHCAEDKQMINPEKFDWHPSFEFDGDVSDHPDFPDRLREQGILVSGMQISEGVFDPPVLHPNFSDLPEEWDGQLRLKQGSPAMNASVAFSVNLPDQSVIQVAAGRNVGAPAPPELRDALFHGLAG